MYSDVTRRMLHLAGWHEGRSVPITRELALLAEAGYPVFPSVRSFLEEFARLNFVPLDEGRLEEEWYLFIGVEDFTLSDTEADRAYYDQVAGATVVPVADQGQKGWETRLYMDPGGVVYATTGDMIWRVSSTGAGAVEAYCAGRTPQWPQGQYGLG